MILHPGIFALLASSVLVSTMMVFAAWHAAAIVARWNLRSGSALQLRLERRTYLVSTLLGYLLLFEVVSFFLYVFTADSLCGMFVGAMCAAGTLQVNVYGYPTLGMKILNLLLTGVWLIMNRVDNRAPDYPLIRPKYGLLLVMAPLLLTETVLQALFFLNLRANIITSCCGSLFSASGSGLARDLASVPVEPARLLFYGATALTAAAGIRLVRTGKGGRLFGALSALNLGVGATALLSFVSIYFYELPTHHCPFCVLQAGYHYVGYPLYASLLGAAATGLGAGALAPFAGIASLTQVVPSAQRRLAAVSTALSLLYAALASWPMVFTDFHP